MIYIPPPKRPSFWIYLAEFCTLITLWGGIIAFAVLARAML